MLGAFLALLTTNEEKKRFNELHILYESTLYNYAYNILEDAQLSEDAVNEAFFSLARNMDKISGRTDVDARNYLIVIVKNSARTILRKRKGVVWVEETECEEMSDPGDVELEVCARDTQDRIMKAVKNMDEKYADVFMLKWYYMMKDAEIARELGLTLENVKIRLHRAKKQLQKVLEEEGVCNG